MSIADNIKRVRERMDAAAARAGRSGDDVALLVVVKTRSLEEIRAVHDTGQRLVAFNRVQEAQEKIPQLPPDFEWHMIGHIQTNKAKFVPPMFRMAHSVDSVRLARALDKAQRRVWEEAELQSGQVQAPPPPRAPFDVLLEANVSGEESKFGLTPDNAEQAIEEIGSLEALRVRGLMTMAPFVDDPENTRPVFRALLELRDRLRAAAPPNAPLEHLSMGMTNDFEVAVEEGATIVRVGTAIFGS